MATKVSKREARELVEALERRIHCGPAVRNEEIRSARDFLRRNDFSPASDYFSRLAHIENRLHGRSPTACRTRTKRNYGGEAGGWRMQVQSIYDHLILSTCYGGEFNTRRGRVKISHRFNEEGRIDLVELKFLKSLDPVLNGELRKLLLVKNYASIRKDWHEAEAFVLEALPRELVFLYDDIFRCRRAQLFAWLVNIGHRIMDDLLKDLQTRQFEISTAAVSGPGPNLGWPPQGWNQTGARAAAVNGNGGTICLAVENGLAESGPQPSRYPDQLSLEALFQDDVARPILAKAAGLESTVEEAGHREVIVRYARKNPGL